MTPRTPELLQAKTCALHGILNIEASAGTGKTYNICTLYERLIAEKGLTVGQILVVTFTEAAAAELRDRIYKRLSETLHTATTAPEAKQRIAAALLAFDDAALFTIHGFCHRALARLAFAAGQPLATGEVVTGNELFQQVAEDFWRQRVLPLAGLEARALMETSSFHIEALAQALKDIVTRPLALHQPLAEALPPSCLERYAQTITTLQPLWAEHSASAQQAIALAMTEKRLNGTKYKESTMSRAWAAWQFIIDGGPPNEDRLEDARRLTQSALHEGKNRPPSSPLLDAFDTAFTTLTECSRYLHSLPTRLLLQLAEEGPARIEATKSRRRVLTFDDMLQKLYNALTGPERMAGLAEQLRQEYPAALIDEFQDTDPLQLAIFRAVYDHGDANAGPLFLVGDPKQAIYSFRGADLHTYLLAKERASRHYILGHNQRSTQPMIDAVNALFQNNPHAFRVEGLEFHPVAKGEKPIPALTDQSDTPLPALAFWRLEEALDGAPGDKARIQKACAEAVATEIVRLLAAGAQGQIRIGDRPLRPGDMAILVRSHAQGKRCKDALNRAGIAAVELSDASVFASPEAEEMTAVLHAIVHSGRTRLLRGALATVLLGKSSAEIAALNQDETRLGALSEQFGAYRQKWLEQGFGSMWQQVLTDHAVMARLLPLPNGERRATNMAHLSERVSAESRHRPGLEALLHWLSTQKNAHDNSAATQLRLESDENLVHIITKHRSKGLQYPFVFCPFLWDDGDPSRVARSGLILRYHTDSGQTILDFAPNEKARAAARREAEEERLRLLYVALTRSIYRCYAVGGVFNATRTTAQSSMLNWLVAGQESAIEAWATTGKTAVATPDLLRRSWQALVQAHPGALGFIAWPDRRREAALPSATDPILYAARRARRILKPLWQRHSFSSLLRLSSSEQAVADHDNLLPPATLERCPDHIAPTDSRHFPRGPRAGDCIHAIFERIDFARSSQWPKAIEEALQHHLPSTGSLKETRQRMLENLLSQVLGTEILPGFRLQSLTRDQRLSEMEFHFPTRSLDAARLFETLQDQGWSGKHLAFDTFTGFLRGSIDLVFAQGERHFVLDWKSNYLGHQPEDYQGKALEENIRQHAYDLQALIYQIALHRSLRHRLGSAYDYDRHFGGALYLFVRAVRPDWPNTGIWHWRPEKRDMEALDRLFPQGEIGSCQPPANSCPGANRAATISNTPWHGNWRAMSPSGRAIRDWTKM